MRPLVLILSLVVICVAAIRLSPVSLLLVSPAAGASPAASLLVRSVEGLATIDDVNSYCLRMTGASTPRCRSALIESVEHQGVLVRLPYMAALDQQATLPPQVAH